MYVAETLWRRFYRRWAWFMACWMTLSDEGGACSGPAQTMTMTSFISYRPLSGEGPKSLHRIAAHHAVGEFGCGGKAVDVEL